MTNWAAFLLNRKGGGKEEGQECHLSHIQQEDLEEEAQSSACDLIGSSADGVAQLAPTGETLMSSSLLKDRGDVSGDQCCTTCSEHGRGETG